MLFSEAFRETLAATAVQTVRLPARSPNLNAFDWATLLSVITNLHTMKNHWPWERLV